MLHGAVAGTPMGSHSAAVQAPKSLPLFRNTSLRLLADLVDLTEDGDANDCTTEEINAALIGVVDGMVEAELSVAGGHESVRRSLSRGDSAITDTTTLHDHLVTVRALTPSPPRVLRFTHAELASRVAASPALLRSLDASDVQALLGSADHPAGEAPLRPAMQRLWLAADPRCAVPIDALAFLLAGARAGQFQEHAAVVMVRNGAAELSIVHPSLSVERMILAAPSRLSSIVTALAASGIPVLHLIVAHPESADGLPPELADLQFHRVVAVMPTTPDTLPKFAADHLLPGVRTGDTAHFSSFVPIVLLPSPGPRAATFAVDRVRIDDRDPRDPGHRVHDLTSAQRMRRDQCRLRLNPVRLRARWNAFPNADAAVHELLADRALATPLERWARAVTNRRVGLALSGGGASIYRVIPLLERLAEARVPIDVVSGVSGGALLGAYYCRSGIAGARLCAERGTQFQWKVAWSILDVGPFERLIDADLGQATLDELEVAFVPLTTGLTDGQPPQAHAVVGGTLGAAVRASGALPVLFSPTEIDGARYADGATSIPVPARALARFGADMVIACNSVPGPEQRNPLKGIPLADFIYRCTPAGRVIDLWVATSSLLQRVSREATEDAHVFIEVGNTGTPLIESFQFCDAAAIVAEAALDPAIVQGADLCARRWHEFARRDRR